MKFNFINFLNILLLILFSKVYNISFSYFNSITLKNENIFIIHQNGICICDSSFTHIIKNIYTFEENERINNEENLSKVEILQFDDGYIISIIIDKIYIFNVNGELDFKSDTIIEKENLYYSLSKHKVIDNTYYFLIGYIHESSLYLYYFQYNSSTKKNSLISKIEKYYDRVYFSSGRYDEYSIKNKGISCQFLKYNSEDVISCFYSIYYTYSCIAIAYFSINENIIDMKFNNEHYKWKNTEIIKSSITQEHKKSLFCFYFNTEDVDCIIFDLKNNKKISNVYNFSKKCLNKYYGIKVDYFQSKKQNIFSCLSAGGGVQLGIFNNNLNNNNKFEISELTDCSINYGYSLLYISDNYFVLSDSVCNDIESSFNQLTINIPEDNDEFNSDEESNENESHENNEISNEEINNEDNYICEKLENCSLCNNESISQNLCIKCNNKKGYYYLNDTYSLSNTINEGYIKCISIKDKPLNFYLNKEYKQFKPCFESCASCNYEGDGNKNNCTSCSFGYIMQPDIINSTNCVKDCLYFYYYTSYDQYKCTKDFQCPDEYSFFIREKGKCIDICEKDNIYKYEYNGECLKECPINTYHEINEFFCKLDNLNNCSIIEQELNNYEQNLTEVEIETIIKNYASHFKSTNNKVLLYKNNIYSILLYKNKECLKNYDTGIPEINFDKCYINVQTHFEIEENLIIAIITKKYSDNDYPKIISFSLHEPKLGGALEIEMLCSNDNILVNENLKNKLKNQNEYDLFKFLTDQNIDIFNLSSNFYTDICFHFKSPIDKDISLKDRVLLFFPNITLCENGCHMKGVDTETFKSICECKLNNLINKNVLENNLLYKTQLGEFEEMLKQTNLEILKCYKDISNSKYISSNLGAFIILFLIITLIICSIIYCSKNLYLIRKYIFNITDKFLSYIYSEDDKMKNSKTTSNEKKISFSTKKVSFKQSENNLIRTKTFKNIERKQKKGKTEVKKKTINMKKNSSDSYDEASGRVIINRIKNKSKSNIYKSKISNKNLSNNKDNEPKNISLESNGKYPINLNISSKEDSNNDLNINMEEYLETDIDDMEYDDAIKKDNRTFCQYFLDKLKSNQFILNTFCFYEPLKPKSIKIILFVLDLDLYFFVNALFINEDYVSEVFHSTKEEHFFSFFPRSLERFLYTTIVGIVVNYIIDCIFIEEKKIKGIFKREKENKIILKYEISQIIKNISQRYFFFIIFSFLMTFFSLYHIFCFNNIYPHMKGEWIKSSFIIFLIMQFLSFLIYLIETVIRIISFKCKSEKLYKISLILS